MRDKDRPDVYEQLNITNDFKRVTCPKCFNTWIKRVEGFPVKCMYCQHILLKSREPWPMTAPVTAEPLLVTHGDKSFSVVVQPLKYEQREYEEPEYVPRDWPQPDDPGSKPDLEWQRQQSYLEYRAEQRMREKGAA
jgi:ribosomal protein S27E